MVLSWRGSTVKLVGNLQRLTALPFVPNTGHGAPVSPVQWRTDVFPAVARAGKNEPKKKRRGAFRFLCRAARCQRLIIIRVSLLGAVGVIFSAKGRQEIVGILLDVETEGMFGI